MVSPESSRYALAMARSIAASSRIEGHPLSPEQVTVLAEIVDGTRDAQDVIREAQAKVQVSWFARKRLAPRTSSEARGTGATAAQRKVAVLSVSPPNGAGGVDWNHGRPSLLFDP